MNAGDPHGARARFLAAISTLEMKPDEPARLCAACVKVLPVQRAAISVYIAGSGLEMLCASDRIAEQAEWAQITLGEGAGLEVVASGGPVLVENLSHPDARWPTFAPEAVKSGVGALYSLPLEVGAIPVGVLNL